MNTNQTNTTAMNTAATNASNILGVGTGGNGGGTGQLEAQLLECLEKLDLVIKNQSRLEQILAANGLIVNLTAASQDVLAGINV